MESQTVQNEILRVEATAEHADSHTYRAYAFEVPPGTAALSLSFEAEPLEVGPYHQAINVALYGPSGFRGLPGRSAPPYRIAADGASPGFLPGAIEPGQWTVEVALGYVLEGPSCTYRLRVWDEPGSPPSHTAPTPTLPRAVAQTGPGWYGGDLHMHTHHSDGAWSVTELWQAVRRRGLDFFVLTDHNTLSGLAELAAIDTDGALPIPGLEVTTLSGHLVAVGVETPIDWRLDHGDRTISSIVQDVHAAGGLAIIAHPGAEPSPVCHGCRWDLADVDPNQIDAVEAWNGPWWMGEPEDNEYSLAFWEGWLARGYRVPLCGDSDAHGGQPTFKEGVPTTYVYAHALSRDAILEGIRAGRTIVSSGPTLRLSGRVGTATAGPGETLPAGGPLHMQATASGLAAPARLRLVGNGSILSEAVLETDGACHYDGAEPAAGWYRADLRSGEDGAMLALTSPLYVAG